MTRSHFLRLWTDEYITVDGMDEQFIMTVQSHSHISYANLNSSSTQRSQEEFIFSIATVIFIIIFYFKFLSGKYLIPSDCQINH